MPSANIRQDHFSDAPRTSATDAVTIFVVSTRHGPEQVFSRRADADCYADGRPGTSVSQHLLRSSVDEAAVIFDRRVVVVNGKKHTDLTSAMRQFTDEPFFISGPADVESFCGPDDQWHIVGFGTDERALNAKMGAAIERACRLSRNPSAQSA